jgi:predicted PurR-regulated permease PerM
MINICVGVCTTAVVWALGVPNAPLWGCLAWFLNYLPYIGPALTTGILLIVGLASFPGLGQGLAPALCFIALTTVEGHFLTPALMGRRLEMNPLAVFLGIAFWTWFWGPVGAFLSVPILVIAMVVWRNVSPPDVVDLP